MFSEEARARRRIPRLVHKFLLLASVLSLVPFCVILWARTATTPHPRIHPIPDMDSQRSYKSQQENLVFADHRAMRPPVEGTVARGELFEDGHFYRGRIGEQWATGLPSRVVVDDALMARGRERYDIFCAPCHGLDGRGGGPVTVWVATGAPEIAPSWTPPTDLVGTAGGAAAPRQQPLGKLFNTITNGNRDMPPYGSQIRVADRWAIVAYLRALQRSQVSLAGDVPVQFVERLNREPGLVIPYREAP